MKRLLITAIICAAASGVFAQNATDSTKSLAAVNNNKVKAGFGNEGFEFDMYKKDDTVTHHEPKYPRGFMGITFSRFDLGYATLIDNGSFTLSSKNQFLDYNQWKTSNVGFD